MTCEPVEDAELMDAIQNPGSGARTLGKVHLSDIYKILMKRLQPKRFTDSPMNMQRVMVGLLFESMLERALAERFGVQRPGEFISPEGVYMSPDGINPTLDALEEYKATYMSSRHGITDEEGQALDKFVHWFVQIKGYLHELASNVCLLRVLFICGDYSQPIGPQFKSWKLTFTDEEIAENWTMLMNIAREEELIAA